MSALELRLLPLRELKPAPYHPRRALAPKSAAYRKLKASLAAFGVVEPLVWNEHTGHLIGGVARAGILAELDYTDVPVSVVRLSNAREMALNVVLNNTEVQSRFDMKKLEPILTELAERPELELTGFTHGVLSSLRFKPAKKKSAETKPSERVEITFVTDDATFATLTPALDKLIGDYELVTHVRRCV